jgi:hypothetical protein
MGQKAIVISSIITKNTVHRAKDRQPINALSADTTVQGSERRETLRLTSSELILARIVSIIHIVICIKALG